MGYPHEGGNMINKVLAIFLYISGFVDSKSIVKQVVWRKKTNKGGEAFINPRWGYYIYIYTHTYVCIYIYIYTYTWRLLWSMKNSELMKAAIEYLF